MDFEGDVLFLDTDDGGEIQIESGEILCDKSFRTAVYLSLFGGNKDDDGTENSKTWWGNNINGTKENEKYVSKFQAVRGLPLTSKNLKLAEDYAKEDLQWLIDEEIADKIETNIKMESSKRINLEVKILKDSSIIEQSSFILNWEATNGI